MFKNEEDKMTKHLLIAYQSLHGIRCKYEEYGDKDGLVEDLSVFIEFCEYHNLFEYDESIKNILILYVESEDVIPWLKERLIKE